MIWYRIICIFVLISVSLVRNSDSTTPNCSLFHFSPTWKWNINVATVPTSSPVVKYHVRNFTQILNHYTFVPRVIRHFNRGISLIPSNGVELPPNLWYLYILETKNSLNGLQKSQASCSTLCHNLRPCLFYWGILWDRSIMT